MPLVNFRKKFRFCSFDFRQNSKVRTFLRWLSIHGTKFFLGEISLNIFFQNVLLVPTVLEGFLNGFSKFGFFIVEICILIRDFWVIFKNYSMCMLSIRGNDSIAHWAYEETISSHTEHTPNEFLRMLSQRKNVNSFYMYNLCWAFGEMILSHPEHTRKWSKCWLSIQGNDLIAHWA
jgi:hypothetical protein